MGKMFRITCSSCTTQFDVKYGSPFGELFQWDKESSLGGNVTQMVVRFKGLPGRAKLLVVLLVLSVVMMFSGFLKKSPSEGPSVVPVYEERGTPSTDLGPNF